MQNQGLSLRWENDHKTIILLDIPKKWTTEGFIATFEDIHAMMASVSHTVHIIVRAKPRLYLPPHFLFELPNLFDEIPANAGWLYIVGGGMLARTFVGVIRRVKPHIVSNVQFTDTFEEARASIMQVNV